MTQDITRMRKVQTIGLIVFCVILLGYWVYANVVKPTPPYMAQDPETVYMISSLGVFKGQPYVYIDHPGTPLEVLGSLFFLLSYPVAAASHDSFIMYQLQHPELFLAIAHGFLTLSCIMCSALLVRYAIPLRSWPDVAMSLTLPALFFTASPEGFSALQLWSHNSFSFPFGTLLLLWLLVLVREKREITGKVAVATGIAGGVLTACQLYFATWVVGIMITIGLFYLFQKHWKQGVITAAVVGAGSLVGFFIATLPVLGQYPAFFNWVISLVTHQGVHGLGGAGIGSAQLITDNLANLVFNAPTLINMVILVLVLLVAVLIWQRRTFQSQPGLWAVAVGVTLQLILTSALFIRAPSLHYLPAIAAILPILVAVAWNLFKWSRPFVLALGFAIPFAILVAFGRQSVQAVKLYNQDIDDLEAAQAATSHYISDYAASHGKNSSDVRVWWTYGAWSPDSALWFGNYDSNNVFADEAVTLYPSQRYLAIDSRYVPFDPKRSAWDVIVTMDWVVNSGADYLQQYGTSVPLSNGRIVIVRNDSP
jgi:hypothetical protein